jgi:hypothetical protein
MPSIFGNIFQIPAIFAENSPNVLFPAMNYWGLPFLRDTYKVDM